MDSNPLSLHSADIDSERESTAENAVRRLAARVEEQRLTEIALDLQSAASAKSKTAVRVAAVSTGRAQAAESFAREFPESSVTCWYIDSFHASRAIEHVQLIESIDDEQRITRPTQEPQNLNILCAADLPDQEYDIALLPLIVTGEAELSRDMMQQLFYRLAIGGKLIVSVDNADDRWVHENLKSYEKSVKVRRFDDAIVYIVEKRSQLKKLKDFSCDLAYRDCDELIQLVTRPGVFSHRQLDNGARQLLDAVDVYPGARLLDIGCGSGSVTLGLAQRDASATIHAVDSNARALWCLAEGVKRNGLENVTMELNATGVYGEPGRFDMALANPPYFGDFQIAEKFLRAAHRSLRAGGRLVLVTKQPTWYQENMDRWFYECEVFPSRRYHIASGIRAS